MSGLKELRLKRGMTVAGLARSAGVARGTVHSYEAGTKQPNAETVKRLADALGVDVLEMHDLVKAGPDKEDHDAAN